jgi:cell division transport system permease protein
VQRVFYESQEQAYLHFKQDFSREPSFTSLVSKSEIPDSFQVKLRNAQTDFTIVAGTVQGRPGVDQIVNDSSLLAKFYKLLDGARNGVVIIAIVLLIAAILLVANTIRLLVEGVLAGLAGWLIAAALLIAVKSLGLDTLQQYFPYNVTLSATDLIEVILLAMVMGVIICGATSFFTLRRYLRA